MLHRLLERPAPASLRVPGVFFAILGIFACDKQMPMDDGGMGDMAMVEQDLSAPEHDMQPCNPADPNCPPVDMATKDDMPAGIDMPTPTDGGGMHGIGDPCLADTDCKAGTMPACWKANVLNSTAAPKTPNGYCSSKCSTDTDCGTLARCVSFGAEKYCLKACADAMTCRHPGYACSFVASGVCFPDSIYDCNPKAGTGTCTEPSTMKPGGCMREAFEDKGRCQATCSVGVGTCADQPTGTKRQCIWIDQTRTGFKDAYQGLICVQQIAMPKPTGATCSYLNECVDGNECDPADGKCRALCVKGGIPGCSAGMTCQDAFMTPAPGPGLCR